MTDTPNDTDVVELLKTDHRTVEALFAKLEADDTSDDEKVSLLQQVAEELIPHSKGEEHVVYPAITKAVPKEGDEVKDGVAEHHHVEEMLTELLRTPPDAPGADGMLAAMIAEVRHHVEEEEQDILPGYAEATDTAERAEVGRRFLQTKQQELPAAAEAGDVYPAGSSSGGTSAGGKESLEDLTKEELYERAKDAGVAGRSDMTKDELIKALSG